MPRSNPRPSVRVIRGAGSGQHLASVLQEGRENANIDAGSGFVWGISVISYANEESNLFVGSANPINIRGLEWFLQSAFPEIRARIPGCELAIAGAASEGRAWLNAVLALRRIESLTPVCAAATVVINPVTFGTGLPVKTIEALSYGRPLVATAAGVRGLGSQFAGAFLVAENAGEFARLVVELLENKAARARLSENALAAVHSWRLQQLTALDAAVRGGHRSNTIRPR